MKFTNSVLTIGALSVGIFIGQALNSEDTVSATTNVQHASFLSGTTRAPTTLTESSDNTKTRSYPDFTNLMANESAAVVNIKAVKKAAPRALSPLELLKRLQEENDNENKSDNPSEDDDLFKKNPLTEKPQTGIGSGFFISHDGYILTNAHVVKDADTIKIKTNNRKEFKATLVGLDTRTDVALLKINSKEPTPFVRTGNPELLRAGEWVAAIGSPFGFENTVTAGIVSAFNRHLPDGNYLPFIQSDVAINPGNSGGPLFNVRGEVVGINTQIYTRSGGYMGLSFSIPIDDALKVADQLREKGKISRSRMGVQIQDMDLELSEALGVTVESGVAVFYVEPNSPADKAGIAAGDIITAFKNMPIHTTQSITRLISETVAETTVPLTVMRGEEKRIVDVKVTSSEALSTDSITLPSTNKKRPSEKDMAPLGFILNGNDVTHVSAEAKQAGLLVGDRIIQIQQTPIHSSSGIQDWFNSNKEFKSAAVFIQRNGKPKMIILPKSTF